MNRITAIALHVVLTASIGMAAQAQAASTHDAKAKPSQRAAEPLIICTQRDAVSRAAQPCRVRRADDAMRLGADITRQEFECVVSGNCGVADRGRING